MKNFKILHNKYLNQDINAYANCDYVGYQKVSNPDYLIRLKNGSKKYDEMKLMGDFIKVCDIATNNLKDIQNKQHCDFSICVVPRSKKEESYSQCQLMFKKAISCATNIVGMEDLTDAIKRIKNTKTTHNWRLENNTGSNPYLGITQDTCYINKNSIKNKNIILVDDIYTRGINVCEDCLQTLLNLGAKSVIMYVIAKTRE